MNGHDEDRMKKLLQQALPPVEGDLGPGRDLWPAVLRRMDARPERVPLFASSLAVVAVTPASASRTAACVASTLASLVDAM